MKKNLISLLLISSFGTSGFAMAAFDKNTKTGIVDITGTLSIPPSKNSWEWLPNSAPIQLDTTTTAMTDNNKKVSLQIANNVSLLSGKTATMLEVNKGVAEMSVVAVLTDQDGQSAPVNFSGANGKGSITLPVYSNNDANNKKIGKIIVPVYAAGVLFFKDSGTTTNRILSASIVDKGRPNFKGMLPVSSNAMNLQAALTAVTQFIPQNEILAVFNKKYPNATYYASEVDKVTAGIFNYSNSDSAMGYTMYVPKSESINIEFDNPINSQTKWKSSLSVNITYI